MTGVSIGVMQPDPRTVVIETRCPHCKSAIRSVALGHVGEPGQVELECQCGGKFTAQITPRELDS